MSDQPENKIATNGATSVLLQKGLVSNNLTTALLGPQTNISRPSQPPVQTPAKPAAKDNR